MWGKISVGGKEWGAWGGSLRQPRKTEVRGGARGVYVCGCQISHLITPFLCVCVSERQRVIKLFYSPYPSVAYLVITHIALS